MHLLNLFWTPWHSFNPHSFFFIIYKVSEETNFLRHEIVGSKTISRWNKTYDDNLLLNKRGILFFQTWQIKSYMMWFHGLFSFRVCARKFWLHYGWIWNSNLGCWVWVLTRVKDSLCHIWCCFATFMRRKYKRKYSKLIWN